MDSVSNLRSILVAALSSAGVRDGEQELFDELAVNETRLLKVFDFGPRNPQEQKEIESGKLSCQ